MPAIVAPTIGSVPGKVPYVSDDTRAWVDAYRTSDGSGAGAKVKPSLIFRAATDSNYVNNQFVTLPAYNQQAFTQSICNVVSPGQRMPGVLTWSVTESLDNITQGAQITLLDALAVSKISTTVSSYAIGTGNPQYAGQGPTGLLQTGMTTMPAQWHSTYIRYSYVRNGNGVAQQLVGNLPISQFPDATLAGNIYTQTFQENNLIFRQFEPEVIVCDLSNFPDPAVPAAEAEGSSEWWDTDTTGSRKGVGAYYVMVDNEVMRVTRIQRNSRPGLDYLFVVPGARGISGGIASHGLGATVTLLGFPPFTGNWTGFGYLMPSDYQTYLSPLRTGTCWVSYEGYGSPGAYINQQGSSVGLSKTFNRANNMCFTGYWFAKSPQITLDNTGVPQLTLTLESAGHILTNQKIDPDNILRAAQKTGGWTKATFDQIGYKRSIPGDWYDYSMWDPVTYFTNAYPLTIATEYAQHQNFFNHMSDTTNGLNCQFCQQEWIEFIEQHQGGRVTGSIAEARQVGKHIYKESIRVFNKGGQFNAGPLKTYGRLMHALAIAAWDNPLEASLLGTRWTKLPNQLFDNLMNFMNGRVFNGQFALDVYNNTRTYDWSQPDHTDKQAYGNKLPLKCPFKAQYDRQPWSQPMQDLSDMNRMTYSLSREGFPIFMPLNMKLRGIPNPGLAFQTNYHGPSVPSKTFLSLDGSTEVADTDVGLGEWNLSYGGAIDNYSHTIDPSAVMTLVYVSCSTAFGDNAKFTIPAAGTGIVPSTDSKAYQGQTVVQYSNQVGNKEGLQLTSGVQQTDSVSFDNVLLGLDWNTDPAGWGLVVKRGPDNLQQIDAQPPIPSPGPYTIVLEHDHTKRPKVQAIVRKLERLLNFMTERRYIGPAAWDTKGITNVQTGFMPENGLFYGQEGLQVDSALRNLQRFLASQSSTHYTLSGSQYTYSNNGRQFTDNAGQYSYATYHAVKTWFSVNSEYIKTDIWWYVTNGLTWDQYVAAIVGIPVPQTPDSTNQGTWIVDQNALKTEIEDWQVRFFQDAVIYGNSIVDDSINKATQKVISTNFADPRIQLGDVIWANVPGYLTPTNIFGQVVSPFLNGIYVTGITRSMDLQQGSFTGSYSGYRYRGDFVGNEAMNAHNYASVKTKI